MVGLILGVMFIVFGVIGTVALITNDMAKYSALAAVGGIILAAGSIFVSTVVIVPAGHIGVVSVFGEVKDDNLIPGFHFKAPWEDVINMDGRIQKSTTELACFSSDIQEVNVVYTLNYKINKDNANIIYKTIGEDYYSISIVPAIAESVKIVTARYTAESLIGNRDELALRIEESLVAQLTDYNIEVTSTAIENIDFTDSFTNAVEAKQVADQKAKQARIEKEQARMEAEYAREIAEIEANAAANVAQIQATADMEVAKINADSAEYQGKKEAAIALQRLASINGWSVVFNEATNINELFKADGNQVTAEELKKGTENLIEYYYTQTWNGVLPETYVGDGSVSTVLLG